MPRIASASVNVYYFAFASYLAAFKFSRSFTGAEEPLALILQKEYLDEPAEANTFT